MVYDSAVEPRLFDVRSMTRMAILVAILCVSAYISFPVPFASAMVTALTAAMNLAAFLLTPKQTLVVMLLYKPEHIKEMDDKYRAAAGKPLDDALVGRK